MGKILPWLFLLSSFLPRSCDILKEKKVKKMRVWIQSQKGERPANKNFFEAMCGFEELGAEICFFHNPMEMRQAEPADVMVGYVGDGAAAFERNGFFFSRFGLSQGAEILPGMENLEIHHLPDPEVIKKAVQEYKTALAGYSLDFGLTDKGFLI